MGVESNHSKFVFTGASVYRITIRGYLDDSWSNRLGGVTIQHKETKDNTTITTLQGELPDQAALFGILNSLYGLGFAILSVESIAKN